MGFWKAEELRKFAFPASECVFGGLLPDELYDVWIVLVRITEMVFCCGRDGITTEMLKLLEKLIWQRSILTEENEGGKRVLFLFTIWYISLMILRGFQVLTIFGVIPLKELSEHTWNDHRTAKI